MFLVTWSLFLLTYFNKKIVKKNILKKGNAFTHMNRVAFKQLKPPWRKGIQAWETNNKPLLTLPKLSNYSAKRDDVNQ